MKRFAVLGAVVFALFTVAGPVTAADDYWQGSSPASAIPTAPGWIWFRQAGHYDVTVVARAKAQACEFAFSLGVKPRWATSLQAAPQSTLRAEHRLYLSNGNHYVTFAGTCAWRVTIARVR